MTTQAPSPEGPPGPEPLGPTGPRGLGPSPGDRSESIGSPALWVRPWLLLLGLLFTLPAHAEEATEASPSPPPAEAPVPPPDPAVPPAATAPIPLVVTTPPRPVTPFNKDRFHFSGFMQATFRFTADEGPNFVSLTLAPVLLWQLHDRIGVEAELDFGYADGGFDVMLEYAQLDLRVADPLTVVGGIFFLPLGIYTERLHPGWINRSLDAPYPYQGGHHGGAFPMSGLGVQARGSVAMGPVSSLNYAAFLVNGPGASEGNFVVGGSVPDNNWNKFVGGRVGLLPVRQVEIGVAGGTAKWDDDGRHPFHVLVVDAMGTAGGFHVQGEFTTTMLELIGGRQERRYFGWAEIAYRLLAAPGVLSRFEFVARWGGGKMPDDAAAHGAHDAITVSGPSLRIGASTGAYFSAGHGATTASLGTDPSAGLPPGGSNQIGGGVNLYLTPSVVLRVGGHYNTASGEGLVGAGLAAGL